MILKMASSQLVVVLVVGTTVVSLALPDDCDALFVVDVPRCRRFCDFSMIRFISLGDLAEVVVVAVDGVDDDDPPLEEGSSPAVRVGRLW